MEGLVSSLSPKATGKRIRLFLTKSNGGVFAKQDQSSIPRFFEDGIFCSLKGAGLVSIRQSRIEGFVSSLPLKSKREEDLSLVHTENAELEGGIEDK